MGNGYMGKILWVDLTRKTITEERISDEIYKKFLSGYGLAAKILFDRIPPGIDPLGPQNILGFVSGLLSGTGVHFSGRWMVVGKSPLTGGWGDSNCGGNFAPAIKKSGYDGIFFVGKSEKPVYLLVEGHNKSLVDADELWGKDAYETEDLLRQKHGKKYRIACIGQGGEQLSLISGIVNAQGRMAGRSGLGAVMGSKKLKALCLNGRQKIRPYDKKRLAVLNKNFVKKIRRDKPVDKFFIGKIPEILGQLFRRTTTQVTMAGELLKFSLRKWGTSGIVSMSSETGDSPIKNWKGVGFRDFPLAQSSSKISDDRVTNYEKKKYSCYACPLGCGGICSVKEGKFPLEETHKPEYETLVSFGSLLLIDDLHLIFKINDMLNRAGIDTISCGVTIAFAFEAFERGILTEEDTCGIQLTWGNGEALLEVVNQILNGEGIGLLLRNGVKVASEKLGNGSEEFAIHAGGQELPMHDARFDPGFGLHYEVEPTPGRHTIGSYQYTDLMALHRKTRSIQRPKPYHDYKDRFDTKGKGKTQSIASSFMDVVNGCGLCLFGVSVGGNPPIAEWINATTGWRYSFDVYLEIGRRIKTLRHAFNLREGIKPKDTDMPKRARGIPPLNQGPLKKISPDFDVLRKEFYLSMGWHPETGVPYPHILKQLGLPEVVEQLEKIEKNEV